MASCPGKKDGHACMSSMYKCKKCGNFGCDQSQDGKCSNQAFKVSKCLKCGAVGQKEVYK